MKEIIARINNNDEDVEIAYQEYRCEPIFKRVSLKKFVEILDQESSSFSQPEKNIQLLHPDIIALDSNYVVIKQEGRKRIVTYSPGKNVTSYKINFPNSIYVAYIYSQKIQNIECYAYKEYKGEKTDLYEYPMPNELYGNNMCIGNAKREIVDNDVVAALERIIFTPYSHSTFSGMNGFSQTQTYFEYLEKNEFPYKMMKSLKRKLKDVLKG